MKGKVNGTLNATFVALIPKSGKHESFAGFRPVSLCNLIYKVITKILLLESNLFSQKASQRSSLVSWRIGRLQMQLEYLKWLCIV
jgi:hypothetical protein